MKNKYKMSTSEEKAKLKAKLREKIKQRQVVRSTNIQKQKIVNDFGAKLGMTPGQIEEIKKMVQKQKIKK